MTHASFSLVDAELHSRMQEWRHAIHRRPGLGFDVLATAGLIEQALGRIGVDEVNSGVGRSGVVGVIRGRASGRVVGLRADMDALPISEAPGLAYRSEIDGAFHGCGHDGHTAMLLGAAELLVANRDFDGTIALIFQPNEENGQGALAMIDDGLLDRFPLDACYGLHNKPGLPAGTFATRVGPMMSSEDLFEITVHGRGGHASMPDRHIDPVVIAAEIVLALQTIVARSVTPTAVAVVSVTEVTTDGARNIVPSTVVIKGDCRTFDGVVQATIERRMRELAHGICAAHGATATVDYHNEFIPLVNTERETLIALETARTIVGETNVDGACALVTASEDFAQFLRYVPGCYIDVGNGVDGRCSSSLHNPNYDFNDDILGIGATYLTQVALADLNTTTAS